MGYRKTVGLKVPQPSPSPELIWKPIFLPHTQLESRLWALSPLQMESRLPVPLRGCPARGHRASTGWPVADALDLRIS